MTVDSKPENSKPENFMQAGDRLFTTNCMGCHGADRKGTGNYPSLINITAKYKDSQIDTILQNGRRMMPSFKQLTTQERQAVISFITDNKNKEAHAFVPERKAVDPYLDIPYEMTGY